MNAKQFLDETRNNLKPFNRRIINHPLLMEVEKGELSIDKIKLFAENQHYIVHHDIRSIALMVSRSVTGFEAEYFTALQNGDLAAFKELKKLMEELGVVHSKLRILHEAVAYTHYLAWLSLYATPGEQAFALIVNLPVWGEACRKLSHALKTKYGVKNTGFLDFFEKTPEWVENDGLKIVEGYLPSSAERMKTIAKLIQGYELMFWDAIYKG
ncbi:MAG: hypothetical protein QW463_01235 [Candidatus Caldarchaeum sp.]